MRPSFALFGLLGLASAPAHAGFVTKDLTTVEPALTRSLGDGFAGRVTQERIIITCADCTGEPLVSIEIGRQTDGTEARVRSGATRIEDLERLCQARSPECRIRPLEAAPAVGWVSSWTIGSSAASTAILLRDGDLLTIRSVANDAATARRTIEALLPAVQASIIGR